MADTTTATTPKKRAPAKRKPAAKPRRAATRATATSSSTRPATRSAREQQLARFERRGGSARRELEREVRRTRTRLERQTRTARRGFDQQRTQVGKNLDLNVEALTSRVEKVVQNGVGAGMKLGKGQRARLPRFV